LREFWSGKVMKVDGRGGHTAGIGVARPEDSFFGVDLIATPERCLTTNTHEWVQAEQGSFNDGWTLIYTDYSPRRTPRSRSL
jgi:hypothetical protein